MFRYIFIVLALITPSAAFSAEGGYSCYDPVGFSTFVCSPPVTSIAYYGEVTNVNQVTSAMQEICDLTGLTLDNTSQTDPLPAENGTYTEIYSNPLDPAEFFQCGIYVTDGVICPSGAIVDEASMCSSSEPESPNMAASQLYFYSTILFLGGLSAIAFVLGFRSMS